MSAQRTRDSLPHAVLEIENLWIPLPDGTRLAARIWLPEGANDHPVPAILEYLPYRKRDFTRARDEPIHAYFAGHGFASLRVDIRGSGDSDGLLLDEYAEQELTDACEVIAWIARQPWCNGRVGMMGISWGGFNALQVAALQPPDLHAIISLCSTDDRYADDAHYMGGVLLYENQQWGSVLLHYNAYPPDPELTGERWRAMWRERLENAVPFPALWMRHPHRDAYWRHGSVCEDFARIRCPVYAIGGWADGYSNAVPRLLAGLQVPRKGLVGPWAHVFPHDAVPGPSIGFLQEALRWWEHWLKDHDSGIMDEPMYRVWMQESEAPRPFHPQRSGRWVSEPAWPSPSIQTLRLHINPGVLEPEPREESELQFRSPQSTGITAGEWCAFGSEGEMPSDQRPDDGRSQCFDSEPLEERLEILGAPVVWLELAVDQRAAFVAVRLNDVAPDGPSLRVTYGLLNLTHHEGHESPQPIEPGRRYRVRVQLNDIAHAFHPGHRLRISISSTYWGIAWPSPRPTTLTLHTGNSLLELPVRPPSPTDAALRPFAEPEQAEAGESVKLRPGTFRRTLERDLTTNAWIYILSGDGGELGGASLAHIPGIALDVGYQLFRQYRIGENDPLSAQAEFRQNTLLRREDWNVRIESATYLQATRTHFHFRGHLRTYEDDTLFFEREWDERIPRKLG